MTVEVIEEENAVLHKKCLQYRMMTRELLDRQLLMERRLESSAEIENELVDLKAKHSVCKTEEEIQTLIEEELEKAVAERVGVDGTLLSDAISEAESIIDPKDEEIKTLQDVLIKMAVASKELSQVCSNSQIMIHFKYKYNFMMILQIQINIYFDAWLI